MHEQVKIFYQAILNIFHTFIPNKTILCNGRDTPWKNKKIKLLINKRNAINLGYTTLYDMTLEASKAISFSKTKYYERLAAEINDSQVASKT